MLVRRLRGHLAEAGPRPVLLARALGAARQRPGAWSTGPWSPINIAWPRNSIYNVGRQRRTGTGSGRRCCSSARRDHRHAVLLPVQVEEVRPEVLAEHRADRSRNMPAPRWATRRRDRRAARSLTGRSRRRHEVARFLRAAPPVRRARRRQRRARRARPPRSSSTAPARRSSPRAPSRSSTCAWSAAAPSRSFTTGACSTCSARASCSGTRRCCRACRRGSRRGPPRTPLCYRIEAEAAARAAGGARGTAVRRAVAARASRRAARAAGSSRRATRLTSRSGAAPARARRLSSRTTLDPRGRAAMMTAAGATSVVVDLGDGALGILTDRDLRTRVLADGTAAATRRSRRRCRRRPTPARRTGSAARCCSRCSIAAFATSRSSRARARSSA